MIVHGTNTLSYKVKILAKDQCFLRTLKDLKRDACSQHNYFFKNGLQAVHGSSIALIRTVSQNFLIGCKPGAFFALCFLLSPLRTGTNRDRPSPDVLDLRVRNWPEPGSSNQFSSRKGALTWQ